MRLVKAILILLLLGFAPLAGRCADAAVSAPVPAPTGQTASGEESQAEHSGPAVTPEAPTIFNIGPIPITNAMIYTWVIALVIFVIVRAGTRKMQIIPSGLQNAIEAAVEGLEDLTKGMLEPKVVDWCFPLIATYFIFIVISNLMGLLPGVGSIGYGHPVESHLPFAIGHPDLPLFRPPTADANTTVAMSGLFFIMSTYWAFKYNGPLGLVKHIFGVKGGMKGLIVIPLTVIFIFIGLIEIISICIRPVALAFRLYGNIYGGENVLTIMLAKGWGGLAAVPFYFLEVVVGVVQALVFTMLCIAFIGTLCSHMDDEKPH
jgi:F-type H+-transporting ATPase subunit a